MRLKQIKLAGFKSFVDPTIIPFPQQMTAVVGPNGCGKSNVIDAIRWVLGESSAKNLRGDAMTDVIFNGSSSRKPLSQASVELVFDNSAGRINGEYASFNELSVRRTVNRDAQSNYWLNGTKCRRRDVTDLFLGTGLGPRSYAIIEQGTISRLIESKPQELRVFIEEAAGVSKYKERRRETETRIRHTKENLARLDDVRSELEQQLNKLQKQASAAQKFKTLKQQERQLNAELATLKWLTITSRIQQLEHTIGTQNSTLAEATRAQSSDDREIILCREQQQDIKQHISDLQQNEYRVSTDITKVEQNQLHAKQKQREIEQSLKELNIELEQLMTSSQEADLALTKINDAIQQALPAKTHLNLAITELQQQVADAEKAYAQQSDNHQVQQQKMARLANQIHTGRNKIQSLQSIHTRTEERIHELKTEAEELNQTENQQAQIKLTKQLNELAHQQAQHQEQINQLKQQVRAANQHVSDVSEQVEQRLAETHSLMAQRDGLLAMQQSQTESVSISELLAPIEGLPIKADDCVLWWQQLEVDNKWAKALELVCEQWQHALYVADCPSVAPLVQTGATWVVGALSKDKMSKNSLASKIKSPGIPSWLCQIQLAETAEQALEKLSSLESHQSVITPDGLWLGVGWIKQTSSTEIGYFTRKNKINELAQSIDIAQNHLTSKQQKKISLEQALLRLQEDLARAQSALEEVMRNLSSSQTKLDWLMSQEQAIANKHQAIDIQLAKQAALASQERQQIDELSTEQKSLKEEHQVQQHILEQHTQAWQQAKLAAKQMRLDLDKTKSQYHQAELSLQNQLNQQQSLVNSIDKDKSLIQSINQKISNLQTEQQQIVTPLNEQQQTLQSMLVEKQSLGNRLVTLQQNLGDVSDKLAKIEKRQQDANKTILRTNKQIQTLQIENEGLRVKASSLNEQILQLGLAPQQVSQSLAFDANEQEWQKTLDRVQRELQALGAVNLAAVDEYDEQAQRKQHLDEQSDDLLAALAMLEQAIRKMDKETRSRFKDTFDQVNSDLKALFPKVFGGGSAYLALTDENLLETGVSIMAQPPGKKNSTIHLLSGGEKALTALSLVFAIFRLNPAPFCLLDEVDAPLDDANVGRFCKLVSEMSKNVQFIYITHNKIAMEMASHLTGVTMAEAGVSRMVAVDVDEAIAIAHA
jgi:chromosome segregation protein